MHHWNNYSLIVWKKNQAHEQIFEPSGYCRSPGLYYHKLNLQGQCKILVLVQLVFSLALPIFYMVLTWGKKSFGLALPKLVIFVHSVNYKNRTCHDNVWYIPLFWQFFRTKPYACEPSSLPKHAPNKEMDAKLREDALRWEFLNLESFYCRKGSQKLRFCHLFLLLNVCFTIWKNSPFAEQLPALLKALNCYQYTI